jgi:hypothetical protein
VKTAEKAKTDNQTVEFPPVIDEKSQHRYEQARRFFAKHLSPLTREAKKAEILTKDDFAIQINAK